MFLVDVATAFIDAKVPFTLVGGYALALQGIVRATVDIDFVVSLKIDHLKAAERALANLGLTSRLPITATDVAHFHEEYRTKRNLIAWSFVDFKNPSRVVDLLIYPPLSSVKAEIKVVAGIPIRVATKQSLLKMKLTANRAADQLDIINLQELINAKR